MSTVTMELKELTREELIEEFLRLNEEYLSACKFSSGYPQITWFKNMRNRLRDVMEEMRRRRQPLSD